MSARILPRSQPPFKVSFDLEERLKTKPENFVFSVKMNRGDGAEYPRLNLQAVRLKALPERAISFAMTSRIIVTDLTRFND